MLVETMKKLIAKVFPSLGKPDKYRPERHYMRGPGPAAARRETAPRTNKAKA